VTDVQAAGKVKAAPKSIFVSIADAAQRRRARVSWLLSAESTAPSNDKLDRDEGAIVGQGRS